MMKDMKAFVHLLIYPPSSPILTGEQANRIERKINSSGQETAVLKIRYTRHLSTIDKFFLFFSSKMGKMGTYKYS